MAEFYLQEASAPLSALECIARDLPQNQHDPHQIVAPETLLCKAIELLVEGGFDAPEYQNLLVSPRFRDILAEACCEEQRKKLQSVAEKFGVERLEILYEESTFTTADGTKRLHAIAYLKDEALGLLQLYIRWWLKGEGLGKNDLHQRMEETGILDPIEDVKTEEKGAFRIIFRALWFSLNLLGRSPASRNILQEIVTTWPAGVPFFDAHDLWLQRRAALLLYDNAGLKPFLEKGCRASLLYYLDLKRGLSTQQYQMIKSAVTRLSGRAFHDDQFDWRSWLEAVD